MLSFIQCPLLLFKLYFFNSLVVIVELLIVRFSLNLYIIQNNKFAYKKYAVTQEVA